jgi:hypothetical protein
MRLPHHPEAVDALRSPTAAAVLDGRARIENLPLDNQTGDSE